MLTNAIMYLIGKNNIPLGTDSEHDGFQIPTLVVQKCCFRTWQKCVHQTNSMLLEWPPGHQSLNLEIWQIIH